MELRQIEFLIQGQLLPMTIGKFRINDNLLLEQGIGPGMSRTGNMNPYTGYTLAYYGIQQKSSFFIEAREQVRFLLLLHSLYGGLSCTLIMGLGTNLENLSELGARRIGFPKFQRVKVLSEPFERDSEYLTGLSRSFNELLPERKSILSSPLGLSLEFYYDAIRADSQARIDHSLPLLITSAESLMIQNLQGIRSTLAVRMACLISESETESSNIERDMKNLYELRSAIIHGGGKKPSREQSRKLFRYIQRALKKCIEMRYLSKCDLIEYLDHMRV